jgi:hypothetical protein
VAVIAALKPSGTTELPFIFVVGVDEAVLVPGDMRQGAVTPVQVEFDGPETSGEARKPTTHESLNR